MVQAYLPLPLTDLADSFIFCTSMYKYMPHHTAIARQNQFLNRVLRKKREFTGKQLKIGEVLLHPL